MREQMRTKPSVIEKDVEQKTALIRAVEKGFYIIAELLIQAGANVNAVSEYGSTALVTASQYISCKPNEYADHGKYIDFLIDEGADVNKNVFGNTALANIVQFGRDDILKSLIEAGAHVNIARGRRGITPLITAMKKMIRSVSNC